MDETRGGAILGLIFSVFRRSFRFYHYSNNYRYFVSTWDQISVWNGDITRLEVDAIVNAANEGLLGGNYLDHSFITIEFLFYFVNKTKRNRRWN